jgi:hypothetical protein
VKKLLAFVLAGGLLALTTGCPPNPTSEAPPVHPGPTGTGTTPPGPTGTTPPAGEEKKAEGKVEKASKDSVTVGGKDYKVDEKTKVTIDGKDSTADKLEKGQDVTVMYKGETATKIEAKKETAPPPEAAKPFEGKVTASKEGKITVKPSTGESKDFTITDDKVVTIDGKPGKAADIKEGNMAAVTTDKDGKPTKVEVTTK